ncbi:MAG TPA: hypothetical protein VKB65_06305 [Myxococcota bacterium]|nr:hypothetical protein [Myxococcota bacterium]
MSHELISIAPPYACGIREDRSRVDFDEAAWPAPPPWAAAYAARQRVGRERMAASRAVLCGLARDTEAQLPLNLARIRRIGRHFADHRIVVYENDSVDGTRKILDEAALRDPRVRVLGQPDGTPHWPPVRDRARTEQLARYRERVRRAVVDRHGDFDLVIVADFDLEGWSYEGIADALGHDGWDAMASTGVRFFGGRPFFYDGFAFRAHGHPEPHAPFELRAMLLPRGAPPVRVDSAFSGLAIYAMKAFAAGRYEGHDCEHATFHASLRAAGFGRAFLNPSMLSLYPDFGEDLR